MLDGKESVPSETSQFTNTSASAGESETGEGLPKRVSCAQDDAANAEKHGAEDGNVAFACGCQLLLWSLEVHTRGVPNRSCRYPTNGHTAAIARVLATGSQPMADAFPTLAAMNDRVAPVK